ncbi:MAG: hypothetical protein KME11_13730 [Timaviella obliquedivisa GSE-PSE-MK23-08B]|jgi:hypothetical protein|nr:hypothetical protein [Timaviella obliquedivisa GSE-PSE-MK23-08B]
MTTTQRLFFLIATCSLLGLGLSAVSSQAEVPQCFATDHPTDDCFNQAPGLKVLEGVGQGLLAGTLAAIGASWKVLKENR